MTSLREFFSLPIGSRGLGRDTPLGVDELGQMRYRDQLGNEYTETTTPSVRPSEALAAAAGAFRDDPLATTRNAIGAIVQGAWNGVQTPGRTLRNDGDPVTRGDVADTALDWGVMGAVGRAPEGSLRIFAGRNARTADNAALEAAQRMAGEGASRDDIWRNTGWFQGVDGNWRFEIDDSGAGLTDYAQGAISQNRERSGRMPTIMGHDDLDAAYGPRLGEVTVDNSAFVSGGYYPDTGAITARAPTDDALRSTLLHETQHAVQGMEGFAQGSSPGSMFTAHMDLGRRAGHHSDAMALLDEFERTGNWDQALRDFAEIGTPISEEGQALARRFGDAATARRAFEEISTARQRMEPLRQPGQWQQDAGFGPYHRAAGEVEARNVQTRRYFTPDRRRATPPWETQDVPDADQLIIRGDELQLSQAPETPAQSVARLLREDPSQITDDMLAALTPNDNVELARLYDEGATGMPMPMDEASRMARADQWWPTDAYHGRYSDYAAVRDGRTFYTTPDAEYAATYTNPSASSLGGRDPASFENPQPNVMPVRISSQDILDTTTPEGRAVFGDQFFMRYGNGTPLSDRGYPDWVDAEDFSEMFADEGLSYRGVLADEGGLPLEGGGVRDRGISTAVFDPTAIRSRFARFDPRLRHLANLSAGLAGGGIMLSQHNREDDTQRLAAYLAEQGAL